MQNTPPMVADVESQLGNTQLCVVGFGAEWNLDGALLDRVAREHRGLYTRAGDGLALKKFFALCFGNIFETGMLVDPRLVLPANEATAPDLEFDVCDEDRITVVVGWAAPGDDLAPTLVTPGGATVAAGGGVATDRGRTWWFLRVPLPYGGERAGRWTLRVGSTGSDVSRGCCSRSCSSSWSSSSCCWCGDAAEQARVRSAVCPTRRRYSTRASASSRTARASTRSGVSKPSVNVS
jgi:hypothetical protein